MGFIIPITANAPIKLITAKNRIMNPAVLKNIPDLKVSASLIDAKLIKARIGNVPKAKTSIVKAPLRKLPVVNE